MTDESFHSDIPQDLHVDEHDGTVDSTPAAVLRRISAEIDSMMSKQHEFIEAVRTVKMAFELPSMKDDVDGTYGPIAFVGSPKMEQISWNSDKFLWTFACVVQFVFDVLIAIPFLFYFVHVQDLRKKRWFTAVYYFIWYLENCIVVALNLLTKHIIVWMPLSWTNRLLGMTCTILFIPIVGFVLLRVYHVKFDPEKLAEFDLKLSQDSKDNSEGQANV